MQTRTKVVFGASLVAALAAGTLGLSAVRAQDGADPKAKPEGKDAPAPAEDLGALVKSLGDADFAVRTRAYDRLKSAGAPALKALEEGAKSEDAQIRWSSGRLLREIDGAAPRRGILQFRDEGDRPGPDAGDPKPGPGGSPGWDVDLFDHFDHPDFRRSMEDLRRRLQEMEQEFRNMTRDMGNRAGDLTRDLAGRGFFRTFNLGKDGGVERRVIVDRDGDRTELHVAADGKVSVKLGHKDADGKPVEESVEAPNMDALRKDHPETWAKVKDLVGDDIQIRVGPVPPLPRFPDAPRLGRLFAQGDAKPVLGVTVSEVPAVLRTQLSLRADEGIVVEDVREGTPAARLGLRHHDVILAVNGIPVSSADDVRSSVGAVKEGGDLRLRVLRGGKVEEIAGTR
jgi:hypothetical protein